MCEHVLSAVCFQCECFAWAVWMDTQHQQNKVLMEWFRPKIRGVHHALWLLWLIPRPSWALMWPAAVSSSWCCILNHGKMLLFWARAQVTFAYRHKQTQFNLHIKNRSKRFRCQANWTPKGQDLAANKNKRPFFSISIWCLKISKTLAPNSWSPWATQTWLETYHTRRDEKRLPVRLWGRGCKHQGV